MKQEDKELLFQDLCCRLPYGVKICFEKTNAIVPLVDISQSHMFPLNDIEILLNKIYDLEWCKPYLRPMSNMTDEEKQEYIDLLTTPNMSVQEIYVKVFKWYHIHHLDYSGLIAKELALEAPEGMYKRIDNANDN